MLLKKRVDSFTYLSPCWHAYIVSLSDVWSLLWPVIVAFTDHIHLRHLTLLRPMGFSIKIDFVLANRADPISWVFAICQSTSLGVSKPQMLG